MNKKFLAYALLFLLGFLSVSAAEQALPALQTDLERCGLKGKVALWRWQDDSEGNVKTFVFNNEGNFMCIMSGTDTTVFCYYTRKGNHTICSVYNMANNQAIYMGKLDKTHNADGHVEQIRLIGSDGKTKRQRRFSANIPTTKNNNSQLIVRRGVEVPLLRHYDIYGIPEKLGFNYEEPHITQILYDEGHVSALSFGATSGGYDDWFKYIRTDTIGENLYLRSNRVFRQGQKYLTLDNENRITSLYTTDAVTMDDTGEAYEFDYYGNIVEVIPISDEEKESTFIQIFYRN